MSGPDATTDQDDVLGTSMARDPLTVLARQSAVPIVAISVVLAALGVVVGQSAWLRAALVLAAAPVAAAAVIDARVHRIPTPLVWTVAAVGVVVLGGGAVATGRWGDLGRGLAAAAVVGGLFFALWWVTRGGTGLGDVRLATALALFTGWLGWASTLWFVVGAHLVAFPVALYRLARGRRDPLPFGPALVAGWYVALACAAWL